MLQNSTQYLGHLLLGLVFASTIQKYEDVLSKMRTVTFSLLSPAFFIRAGLLIGLPAVIQNIALIISLLAVKLLSKFAGTYLLSKKLIDESVGMFSALLFKYWINGRINNCNSCKGSWLYKPDPIFGCNCYSNSECYRSNTSSETLCTKENIINNIRTYVK